MPAGGQIAGDWQAGQPGTWDASTRPARPAAEIVCSIRGALRLAEPRPVADAAIPAITLRRSGLNAALWSMTGTVMTLGVAREILLSFMGTETVLKDLRHIAFDVEHCLPAWFSSMLMLCCAVLLATCSRLARLEQPRDVRPWAALAAVFALLSIDEAIAVHEATIDPLRQAFDLSGFLYFGWVLIAAPILLAAALFFLPFLLRLPRRVMWRFMVAGLIFVSGAIGMELIGGHYASSLGFGSLEYRIAFCVEESLELIGLSLFATELLSLIARRAPSLALHIR